MELAARQSTTENNEEFIKHLQEDIWPEVSR